MAQLGTTNINGDCSISGNLNIVTGNGAINHLVDLIYPVGSYFFSNSSNFATVEQVEKHFGGSWTKLGDGYFIEAGSSITTKSPGLPNITGNFDTVATYGNEAFARSLNGTDTSYFDYGDSGGKGQWSTVSFNANNGASTKGIYGNSSTVQPKSRTAYIYYRTA